MTRVVFLLLVFCCVCLSSAAEKAKLQKLGEAVRDLLTDRDVSAFATKVRPSQEDYQKLIEVQSPPALPGHLEPGKIKNTVEGWGKIHERAAKMVLGQASRIGLEFGKLNFRVRSVEFHGRRTKSLVLGTGTEGLPQSDVVFTLEAEARDESAQKFAGTYSLAMSDCMEFPEGLRSHNGLRWRSLPSTAADKWTIFQLALAKTIREKQHIELADDPMLKELGDRIISWLDQRDNQALLATLTPSVEEVLDRFGVLSAGQPNRPVPPKAAVKNQLDKMRQMVSKGIAEAGSTLKRIGLTGDAYSYQLVNVKSERIWEPRFFGDSFELQLMVGLEVELEARSASLRDPIKLVLELSGADRMKSKWVCLMGLRWKELPSNLTSDADRKKMALDNYVAKYGALPAGMKAPEVKLIRINDESQFSLKDLRGKFVVLEFWSTTCGPCQAPMAKLQKVVAQHPDWKDEVAWVTVSIDEKKEKARRHLEKRGWTKSMNTWAGKDGWHAPATKQFRVTSIPRMYVIDPKGVIAHSTHPGMFDLSAYLARLIKESE